MKNCIDDVHEAVVALEYIDKTRRFVAGYANGLIRIYDESALDDCPLVRTLEEFNRHPELIRIKYSEEDKSVLSVGASSEVVRLWDIGSGKCELEISATDQSEAIIHISFLGDNKLVVNSENSISDGAENHFHFSGRKVLF
jgi:WD40 repeat protein